MYPDPSVTWKMSFTIVVLHQLTLPVIPVTAKKNGGEFDFRYDSEFASAAKFDDSGTSMTIRGYTAYPLETYANFEFPSNLRKMKNFLLRWMMNQLSLFKALMKWDFGM